MIDHLTFGGDAASAGARVTTALIGACLVAGTVLADCALGSAERRIALVIGSASANGIAVDLTTNPVWSAGRGLAGTRYCSFK